MNVSHRIRIGAADDESAKSRNQQERKLATAARNEGIQNAATQVWEDAWSQHKEILAKTDVAKVLLNNESLHDLLRDTRSRHGERLSEDSIERLISLPELLRAKRRRRKDIH